MENLYEAERSPLDVAAFVWRHRGKMALTLFAGIALTLAYLSLTARNFRSEAKLLVRLGREAMTIDPTATTGQFVAMAETRENELHGVEELLTSRATAEAIVDQFGPKVILEKKSNGPSLGDRLGWLDSYNLNPLKVYSLRDKAVKALNKNLGVSVGKKSNVLSISYKSEDPQLAHDILAALLVTVREDHLRVHRTRGSQEFFESQRELLQKDLATQEEGLRNFKDERGVAILTTQRDAQVGLIAALEADLLRAKAEQSAVAAEVELRRRQLRNQPALVVTEQTTGQPQTARQTLRERLYELEIREQDLAARLKDNAPQLVHLRSQIAESRRIAGEELSNVETKTATNQTHQAAELALQEREAQLVALTARTESLESKVVSSREELKKLNSAELDLTRLERELELARASYRKYSENLEQARIDHELEAAKISSLNIMQPPTLSPTPVSPQPLPTLALGFCAALVASFGVALAAENRPQRHSTAASLSPPLMLEPSTVPARVRRTEAMPANPR